MGKGFYVTVIIHEATDFARFDENKETSSRFPPLSRDEGYTQGFSAYCISITCEHNL